MLPMVQPEPALFNCGAHSVDAAVTPPSATSAPSLTPDSEVNDLDIFFDVDDDINTFQRIESCDLQPGDSWRGMQGKMSMTAQDKKRKKSDNKPQSQINKCHNEKRRRELENETINQLEELLGTCLAEVKQPDKNGIVREATRQIQEVLNRRRECPSECPVRVHCLSPVQGGEVSSTQPPPGLHYSEITTVIEALKHYTGSLGWVLLELNAEGEIECVTENVKDLIHQDRKELYKKSIYEVLHLEDHEKFRPLLRDTQAYGYLGEEADKFQVIQARLIKNIDGTEDTGLVECVIHAAPVRGARGAAGCVMCVIRRCDDASAQLPSAAPPALRAHSDPNIVFRLDAAFTVLWCEVNNIDNLIDRPERLVGCRYLELVESSDRAAAAAHLRAAAALPAPPAHSAPFRLRLAPHAPPLRVTARSRLFPKPATGEPDFIMSAHTLVTDEEADAPAQPPAPTSPQENFLDFDLEPWSSPYQLAETPADEDKERRDSTNDSGSGSSRPVEEEPNRLRLLLSKKPEASGSNNRILKVTDDSVVCSSCWMIALRKTRDMQSSTSDGRQRQLCISCRCALHRTRYILYTDTQSGRDINIIQLNQDLLKQEEEDAGTGSETSAPHTPHTPHTPLTPAPAPSPLHAPRLPLPQHALLRVMLNDKDEESEEAHRNEQRSQPSVLSQLLSTNGPSSNGRSHNSEADNYFDRIAGVKRKFDDGKGLVPAMKRPTTDSQQVTSSASSAATSAATTSSSNSMSMLCQKNQILVSLLARQQTAPLAAPTLRTFPQRTGRPPPPPPPSHPPVNMMHAQRGQSVNVNGSSNENPHNQSHLALVLSGVYPPSSINYAAPAPNTNPNMYNMAGGNRASSGNAGDSEVPSDQTLSDILDEVIDNMPDGDRPAPDALDAYNLHNLIADYASMKEKNAMINAIRQSLMQCETVSKSPQQNPGGSAVYPQQSPGGSSALSGAGGAALYARDGAGDAARARALVEQQRARLLSLQQQQQLLVSPEAADQPQQDLGSTINALVSATPPNVTLTRADYHHMYPHPTSQMGQSYGTNKITSSQQNPMLSRQLSVQGSSTSGYAHSPVGQHSAAALHTPMTPQPPYSRAPRPQLVSGYYEDGASGYGAEYARRAAHAPLPTHEHMQFLAAGSVSGGAGVGGAGAVGGVAGTSEYVRNELRAVVGARSARPDLHPPMPPSDLDPLISFDMQPSGGAAAGPASGARWDHSSTTEAGSAAAAAVAAGGDSAATSNPSLLQKLLSQ